MNELRSDSEFQSILKEARENYQKRIQSLKSSMQGIANEIPSDRYGITERCEYNRGSPDKELVQSLSRVQVLEIENQNLKEILKKESFENRTPPRCAHRKLSSFASDSAEMRLKETVSLLERENKELKLMNESMKEDVKELAENQSRLEEKIKKLTEENGLCNRKNKDIQGNNEKLMTEIDKLKKEKIQLTSKAQKSEDKFKIIQGELDEVKLELSRHKEKDPPGVSYLKYKSKIRGLKEKTKDLTEKLEKSRKNTIDLEIEFQDLAEQIKKKTKNLEEREFFIKEIQGLSESLKGDLQNANKTIKDYQESIEKLKDDQLAEKNSWKASKNELVSSYEEKLNKVQQESSEKISKTAQDILSQLDQIEIDYKIQLSEKSEKLIESEDQVSLLLDQNSELKSSYQSLKQSYLGLEDQFYLKFEEYKKIYNAEVAQHKSDITALESEVQKLYESKSKSLSDIEVMKEKYNILKQEYFDIQQKLHNSSSVLEEAKKRNLVQEKEISSLKNKEFEWKKEIQLTEEKFDQLLTENRVTQEEKIKQRLDLEKLGDQLLIEKRNVSKLRELVKISFKQMKNEIFQLLKQAHRGIFEDLLACKKAISENSQVLLTKLDFSLQTWSSLLSSSEEYKQQVKEHFLRESNDLNDLKLHLSQLERELHIKEDRIFYLESSLKHSISRHPQSELLKSLLSQIAYMEEEYSENYKDLVDMVITLKSFISKDQMEGFKDIQNRSDRKDFLLKQARIEIIKQINDKK